MVYMKRLLRLSVVGLVFILQGCAVYPYAPPAYNGYYGYGYPSYVYRPYGNFGWGGGYNRGFGGGGHHGWGRGHR